MKGIDVKNLLSSEEVKTLAGVSWPTLKKYREMGVLPKPIFRRGRKLYYDKATVEAAVEGGLLVPINLPADSNS